MIDGMLERCQVFRAHFSRTKSALVNIFIKFYNVGGGFAAVSRDSFTKALFMFNTSFLSLFVVNGAEGKRIVPVFFNWIIERPLLQLEMQM